MSPLRITRCVCYDRTFAELKRIAGEHGCTTIVELQQQVEFGLNCRLCHPYVRRMLKTGETVFDHVISD